MSDTSDLTFKFWKALAESPFVFLQLDGDRHGPVPMTARLDRDAEHAIWFFTARDHHLTQGGPATATFASRGHDLFARFTGTLGIETSRERLEKEWDATVEAWFPGGKDDPDLLMLRMDLGEAELWNADFGFLDDARMLLGFDMRAEAADEHIRTRL